MHHRVLFSPEARQDLITLYGYIAKNSGEHNAITEIERIETYCRSFSSFPERGTRRDDIRTGLRVVSFQRRATIAFHIDGDAVVINRILYRGRSLEAAMKSGV